MDEKKETLIEKIISVDSPKIIDIDETGFNFMPSFINYLNYTYGISMDVSDVVVYDFSRIKTLREIGVTFQDILENLRNFGNTEEFVHIPTLDGFVEFYKRITNDFNNLEKAYFVTSRSEEFYDYPREKTIETLKNNKIPFLNDNLILTNEKHDFAMSKNARFVFDDSIHIAEQFLTNNYSGHIIMNNTSFNSITEKDKILLDKDDQNSKIKLVQLTYDPRVTRINSWYDLLNGKN